jgi:GDP-4-dehydro-6-deoxy-D-mannose reductase
MTGAPRGILLTGASGFVGSHLLPALAAAFPAATLHAPLRDLRETAACDQIVRDALPDVCVHLAAASSVAAAREDEAAAWQINLHASLDLARALLRHVPHCRLLYVSSSEVYGATANEHERFDERAALAPMNAYSATKAAADLALGAMAAQNGLRVIRLRPFNHTGSGQSSRFVVAAFARQLARIKAGAQPPRMQVGNLDPWRDFLDVRDVCAGYVACIAAEHRLPGNLVLNLASGVARRIGDVLDTLRALAGVSAAVETDAGRVRSADLSRACGDATRAGELLGWRPVIPWERTLRDVLDDWSARVRAEPADNV